MRGRDNLYEVRNESVVRCGVELQCTSSSENKRPDGNMEGVGQESERTRY